MLKSALKRALGLGTAVVEGARIEGESTIVSARPRRAALRRPACGRRRDGHDTLPAKGVKGLRLPLLKSPEDLSEGQASALGAPGRSGTALWRGYLLKEGLRAVFRGDPADARASLDRWLSWACRCRIPQFVELSRKVRRKRGGVLRSIELGVSNARVEAVNNKIKVAVRQGYGFRNIDNLIALVMLRCSDLRPALPGRAAAWPLPTRTHEASKKENNSWVATTSLSGHPPTAPSPTTTSPARSRRRRQTSSVTCARPRSRRFRAKTSSFSVPWPAMTGRAARRTWRIAWTQPSTTRRSIAAA